MALPETPADLEPAAGILTQGEGNVLSHVQLLARALGIPNVVLGPAPTGRCASHDGQQVFFLATPRGRVVLKEAAAMTLGGARASTTSTRATRSAPPTGASATAAAKLHIDRAKLDVDHQGAARSDQGAAQRLGPDLRPEGGLPRRAQAPLPGPASRAASSCRSAPTTTTTSTRRSPCPTGCGAVGIATAGEPLPAFVERTYETFFGELIAAGKSERELSAWIAPRLEVIRHSIRQAPLSPELRDGIRAELDRVGLLTGADKRETVGCFVRSDTNVEDLDNFNGAGLNLTSST